MTGSNKKCISVHNLKTNMVLADDAIAKNGQILIPAGTVITENHLFRMNLYQILSAVVLKDSTTEAIEVATNPPVSEDDHVLTPALISINDHSPHRTEDYLRFSKAFTQVDQDIRNHFDAILLGQPIDSQSLLTSVETMMKSVRLKSDLFTYMSHIKGDNDHTYAHSVNVAILCNTLGRWLKMKENEIKDLTIAALIHDIGKTKISPEILNKIDRLTEEEYDAVRQHAQLGYNIIDYSDLSDRIKQAVLLHHERNDGSGYPFGYTGQQIPDFAKIIAIADIYDAMTSSRSYHTKFSPFKVIQLFEQESAGYLDTKYLFIFLENIAHYYLGEEVLLSDGSKGKIVFIHNESPSRPIIKSGDEMIDLMTTRNLSIEELL